MFENHTVNLSASCTSCAKVAHRSSEFSLCGQLLPKCERAVRHVYPPFFCRLRSVSNPTNKNQTELVWRFKQHLGNRSELDTCSYELFYLSSLFSFPRTMVKTITSQSVDLSSYIIQYLGCVTVHRQSWFKHKLLLLRCCHSRRNVIHISVKVDPNKLSWGNPA